MYSIAASSRSKMSEYDTYLYENGVEYTGSVNEAGLRHGFGQMCYPDGTRYVGSFEDGLSTGVGVMWFSDGSRYEGELLNGWFHGHGIFQRRDGMLYEGEFRAGHLWGYGLVTFRDGSHGHPRHEGYFQNSRFVRRENCLNVADRAQEVAAIARNIAEQSEF